MTRLNFLNDEPWDDVREDRGLRSRSFGGGELRMLGASLQELEPGAPGHLLHMHYNGEEMFFVLAGTPTLRTPEGERQLAPGDVVSCPEGAAGLHTFMNRSDEPARILGVSAGGFPDVVAYPEDGYAWVATRNPHADPGDGDPGIIARFALPPMR